MNLRTIIVALLAIFAIYFLLSKEEGSNKTIVCEKLVTDTVLIVDTDTVIVYEPKYFTQRVIDTLHITDTLYLPITQKHYSERGLYDVWVSGYEAKMDSIKTYNKTEYKYVEKEVTREVVVNRHELYLNGGLNAFSGTFVPKVGVSFITPKKTHYSVNVGLYKGELTYEIGVGLKLF